MTYSFFSFLSRNLYLLFVWWVLHVARWVSHLWLFGGSHLWLFWWVSTLLVGVTPRPLPLPVACLALPHPLAASPPASGNKGCATGSPIRDKAHPRKGPNLWKPRPSPLLFLLGIASTFCCSSCHCCLSSSCKYSPTAENSSCKFFIVSSNF